MVEKSCNLKNPSPVPKAIALDCDSEKAIENTALLTGISFAIETGCPGCPKVLFMQPNKHTRVAHDAEVRGEQKASPDQPDHDRRKHDRQDGGDAECPLRAWNPEDQERHRKADQELQRDRGAGVDEGEDKCGPEAHVVPHAHVVLDADEAVHARHGQIDVVEALPDEVEQWERGGDWGFW